MAQYPGGRSATGQHLPDRLPGRNLLVGTVPGAAQDQGSGLSGQDRQIPPESYPEAAFLSAVLWAGAAQSGGSRAYRQDRAVFRGTRMSASPFVSVSVRDTLRRHQLDSFDALWNVAAQQVDEPNRARGGFSSVSRLTLEDANGQPQVFYLKRQSNYLIRSLRRPLGEPTAGREFYNIGRYAERGIPALEAAYYARRRVDGKVQAILLTRALEGYQPLDHWFSRWDQLGYRLQRDLLIAAAALVAQLHGSGVVHNCLYPKHLFLKPLADGVGVRLIDLEKSRAHL